MRIGDARWELFRRDLPDVLREMAREETYWEVCEMAEINDNTLGRLNDVLFDELAALRACDPHDAEALRAEVERSRAVEGIARTVIENAGTVLQATRMRAQYAGERVVRVPRMLEG